MRDGGVWWREEGKEKFFQREEKLEYSGECEEKGKNIFEKEGETVGLFNACATCTIHV